MHDENCGGHSVFSFSHQGRTGLAADYWAVTTSRTIAGGVYYAVIMRRSHCRPKANGPAVWVVASKQGSRTCRRQLGDRHGGRGLGRGPPEGDIGSSFFGSLPARRMRSGRRDQKASPLQPLLLRRPTRPQRGIHRRFVGDEGSCLPTSSIRACVHRCCPHSVAVVP